MALSNAERQQRWRDRRRNNERKTVYRRPADRRSRSQRVHDAVAELLAIGDEYRAWRDALPESLAEGTTAELLDEAICAFDEVDLDRLADLDLPQGFGRDG